MEKQSKIYVAGHNGLVGSAIWKNLKSRGYNNLIGKSSKELDLRDGSAVESFFQSEKPEFVFLAAAKVGGIVANNTYRADFIFENLAIQNNVIGAAYRHGVKKLLFLGSTCIYPRDCAQPMKEESLLTSPLEYTNEPYAIAKIAGLKMCESFNLQYGTDFIAVMPTNLYGPNDNFDLEKSHVLPALIRKNHLGKCLETSDWEGIRRDLNLRPIEGVDGNASENEIVEILGKYGIAKQNNGHVTIEIWGTGKPMREFLWSEEMADACVYIMERVTFKETFKADQKEIRNCHINIGTGNDISIGDLAKLIKKEVGFSGDLVFNTSKPDGTMKKLTDVSKLHALGWKHQVEIHEGVKKVYEWYLK
ncbi:GDP-L-fucose synthase [Breznakibacter xylanolyticus]|uniref:GDP-L-fucose synthase n=1 Tax=Breznakibacter xylanolyticus TaxID=990 RepID=A0A2W7P138_9BACT|nr:GDP-L-fucose synthase [Breznakibacter xylanolyticus]PZX19156.1 GDP-L-fucose synthase [Breznakibacter xylanolyticus]